MTVYMEDPGAGAEDPGQGADEPPESPELSMLPPDPDGPTYA